MKNVDVDLDAIRSTKYLHEFDRELQCPAWGYPTEGAYYRDASSADSVFAIRIPCLVIHAEDDPVSVLSVRGLSTKAKMLQIVANEAVPYDEIKQNPQVVACSTSVGGHLAWFELGGSRWFAKPVRPIVFAANNGGAEL